MEHRVILGRSVSFHFRQVGRCWDWSYTADTERVVNSEELAPSREVALSEAISHAERSLRHLKDIQGS